MSKAVLIALSLILFVCVSVAPTAAAGDDCLVSYHHGPVNVDLMCSTGECLVSYHRGPINVDLLC